MLSLVEEEAHEKAEEETQKDEAEIQVVVVAAAAAAAYSKLASHDLSSILVIASISFFIGMHLGCLVMLLSYFFVFILPNFN